MSDDEINICDDETIMKQGMDRVQDGMMIFAGIQSSYATAIVKILHGALILCELALVSLYKKGK